MSDPIAAQANWDYIRELSGDERSDASSLNGDTTTTTTTQAEDLPTPDPYWKPSVQVEYERWELADASLAGIGPLKLFLKYFGLVLNLIVERTNLKARAELGGNGEWDEVTEVDVRRWIACRFLINREVPANNETRKMFQRKDLPDLKLSYDRYLQIEKYLLVFSDSSLDRESTSWFWKVEDALRLFRDRMKSLLIPSSHICCDESTIEFHGRQADTTLLRHKPAGEGWVL